MGSPSKEGAISNHNSHGRYVSFESNGSDQVFDNTCESNRRRQKRQLGSCALHVNFVWPFLG